MARCDKCSASCGDDYKTKTKYKQESNVGDRLKVILLQIYDMSSIDNLQVSEIRSLIDNLIKEHLYEFDLSE